MSRIFRITFFVGAIGLSIWDAHAAAPMPESEHAMHLVTRVMTPRQMIDAEIFGPLDICGICQNELGSNDQNPVIAIHCSPESLVAHGQHHVFHANCIKTWWLRQIGTREDPSCPACRKLQYAVSMPGVFPRVGSYLADLGIDAVSLGVCTVALILSIFGPLAFVFFTTILFVDETTPKGFLVLLEAVLVFLVLAACSVISASYCLDFAGAISSDVCNILNRIKTYLNGDSPVLPLFERGGVIELN